jgi:molybdopterin/thiamine biosynthesis adenylyltransferase
LLDGTRHREAIQSIEHFLTSFAGVRTLSTKEVSNYGNVFSHGWEIPGLCVGTDLKLRLLLPFTAPFSAPRVAVWPAPPVLEWPHIEDKGLLCLLSEAAAYSVYDSAGVATDLLKNAIELIKDNLSVANISDFEDEFQSYWTRWEATGNKFFYLNCRPASPSRWVSSWHAKAGVYVADDDSEVMKWIGNRFGEKSLTNIRPQRIPLLWLPRALRPKEYPKSLNMLFAVLKELGVDSSMIKELLLDEKLEYKSVTFGFTGTKGVAFAGLSIGSPATTLKNGFRGRPPDDIILMRYRGTKLSGSKAVRLDNSWIHGRDHNPHAKVLATKTVVVFGIGSIGCFVAELLALSGIGQIVLVDPDLLVSENASRHVLGVDSIGKNKATAMAQYLASRFPHLIISGHSMTCEGFCNEKLSSFKTPDLLISAIGSWRTEGWLNAMMVASSISSPVLYGWSEPHAAAGHAVVVRKEQNGCLRCIRDDMGKMKLPVTMWPDEGTLLQVPACGGYFQPYGAIEISHIHGLIADLALNVLLSVRITPVHKIWVGSKKIIDATGGTWNTSWTERHGELGEGGMMKTIEVISDPVCPECGRRP